jgi:nucleoside-diphosphate-sugar epimerase
MKQDEFLGPVNIGSEEMVSINELAEMAIDLTIKTSKSKTLMERTLNKNMALNVQLV